MADALPPKARTALILTACGFTTAEIAGLMGYASKSGVTQALMTARKNLGAATTPQAVARAIWRGVVDPGTMEAEMEQILARLDAARAELEGRA